MWTIHNSKQWKSFSFHYLCINDHFKYRSLLSSSNLLKPWCLQTENASLWWNASLVSSLCFRWEKAKVVLPSSQGSLASFKHLLIWWSSRNQLSSILLALIYFFPYHLSLLACFFSCWSNSFFYNRSPQAVACKPNPTLGLYFVICELKMGYPF